MPDFRTSVRFSLTKKAAILLLATLLLLHFPFIDADPDISISKTSRDAFTDEGLNTNQLRNYIHTGKWDMYECDNLVKNPLFNGWLLPFLKVFGTSRAIVRFSSMLLGFLLLGVLVIYRLDMAKITIVMVLTILSNYYLFQYEQFTMAEWGACCIMLTSLFFLYKFLNNKVFTGKIKDLIFAIVFAVLATGFKIQFVYFQLLIPAAIAIDIVANKSNETSAKYFIIITGIGGMAIFNGLYILLWYLPNREIFNYVMSQQTGGRWINSHWFHFLRENFERAFLSENSRILFFAYLITIGLGWVHVYTSRKKDFALLFTLSLVWSMVELHKIFILYVPTRYLISTYFSQGLLVSIVLAEFVFSASWAKSDGFYQHAKTLIGVSMLTILFLSSSFQLYNLYCSRSFSMKEAGEYLEKNYKGHGSILGAWGTSLSWNLPARSLPIWKDYHYDVEALKIYPPAFIITEWNQEDSGEALKSAGIYPDELSESRRDFVIGRYKLFIYKMK
jgi:hypothetical protein